MHVWHCTLTVFQMRIFSYMVLFRPSNSRCIVEHSNILVRNYSILLATFHRKIQFCRFFDLEVVMGAESRGCRPGMYPDARIREDFFNPTSGVPPSSIQKWKFHRDPQEFTWESSFVLDCILQNPIMARAPWRHAGRSTQFLLRAGAYGQGLCA